MRAANPSWSKMPNLRRAIKSAAKFAEADAGMSAAYRGLRLNLGVDDSPGRQLLMSADNWRALEGLAPKEGFPVLGIDLGGSVSMSAACGSGPRAAGWRRSRPSLRILICGPGVSVTGRGNGI